MALFEKALPVWVAGENEKRNSNIVLKTEFAAPAQNTRIYITGATLYQVWLNGMFLLHGPARCAHNFSKVDEIDLTEKLIEGVNELIIYATGYQVNCYQTVRNVNFVQAEIRSEEAVLAATGFDFAGGNYTKRVEKVERYAFQRYFIETYEMDNQPILSKEQVVVVEPELTLIPRDVALPEFNVHTYSVGKHGNFTLGEEDYQQPWYESKKEPEYIHYPDAELDKHARKEYSRVMLSEANREVNFPVGIQAGEYVLIDFGRIYTGFVCHDVKIEEDAEYQIVYDEYLTGGKMDSHRWGTNNIMEFRASAGQAYHNETLDVYGMRFAAVLVLKGKITLRQFSLRDYVYPLKNIPEVSSGDASVQKIYRAAVETYRQNAVDIYMDCPTRERAGWLCDSYFTSQTEFALTGKTQIEDAFLKNFVLASGKLPQMPAGMVSMCYPSEHVRKLALPEGMVPMCYPAEHEKSSFIPQWAMWLIMELDSYFRRNPEADKDCYKELIYGILGFLANYCNEDGLLERLPGWNFVEWSKANDWVMDVNYPTNMLYACVLEKTGKIYDDTDLIKQAEAVREEIIRQSFNGTFFVDNAVRGEDGKLRQTKNISETNQYYAVFTGLVSLDDPAYEKLKDIILGDFGPERRKTGKCPEVAYANAFIGIYLRMEIMLSRPELHQQLLTEIKGYFENMANLTGTLWENEDINGSLNHGFASFIAKVLLDICGKKEGIYLQLD